MIDVTQPLGNYSVAIQQMVAIVRALEIASAKMLILDEPTSSLDIQETNRLFDVMRKLKGEGIGIIFITHFLDQVYQIADRITVLRNGKLVGTYDIAALPADRAGRQDARAHCDRPGCDVESQIARSEANSKRKRTWLEAKGWVSKGSLEPIDLELNANEVVGIAGLLGSGRTELADLIFGIDTPDKGSLLINGQNGRAFFAHESLKRGSRPLPRRSQSRRHRGRSDHSRKYHPGVAGALWLVQVS